MDLDRALEHALDGRALLFTGAGFSRGAVNLRGGSFKSAAQFANYLGTQVGLPEGTPLDDASEEFAQKLGGERLLKEIQTEFTARQISKSHEQIPSVRWRKIYTTNYDNVIEQAYLKAGRNLTSVTMGDDIRAISKDPTLCIHLNGYVGRLTLETIWSEAKVTDTSYLTASLAASEWATLFREDVEIASAVFFIGYSLSDLDLRRILFESKTLKEKCFFVVGESPSPSTISRAKRFGTPLHYGTDKLLLQIARKTKSYSSPELIGPIPYCLHRYQVTPGSASLPDRAVFDLLLLGHVGPNFVWKSLHGGKPYALEREAARTAFDYIQAGAGAVVLHSDLGNGKTLILEEIKCKAFEKDYAVYTLVRRADSLYEELDQALQGSQKKLFVVDGYPDWLDVLQTYASRANSQSTIVLSARTSVHDLLIDRLAETLRAPNMKEIAVDVLSSAELGWVSEFFDEYGLWGGSATWSKPQKVDHLRRACHSQWHAILIRLFESPEIRRRLDTLFEDLRKKRNYYDVLVALMILSVLEYVPSVEALPDLAGPRVLETGFKRDPAIREVVDFKSGEIRLRSSVVGEFVLRQIADPNATVQVLISLAKSAHKFRFASPFYLGMLKALARFSNLQHLLPETGSKAAIFGYYETIKVLDFYRTAPLFWLQYAIAGLVFNEFDRAKKYFDAAYSFARGRGTYDSHQIDNHYARFLLVRAIHSRDASRCMADFRAARHLILTQMQRERLHYPYRVATTFAEFYEVFAPSLGEKEKGEIISAAKAVGDRIGKLPDSLQKRRQVIDCLKAMEMIIRPQAVGSSGTP